MLKKFILVLAVVLFVPLTAAAQAVTAVGTGGDRASALADAKRVAVEEVIGSYVDSRTLVAENVLALDEVVTKAVGFVTDVKIIDEKFADGVYTVKANVNVAENSALADKLSAIMSLNDPRIAVIVLKEGTNTHEERVEAAIAESLIDMGFHHVVDTDIAAGLSNAQMLRSLYEGRGAGFTVGDSFGADFVVLGKLDTDSANVVIPDFKGGYKATALNSGRASMTAKIIRLDTADILSTFSVSGKSMETSQSYAEREAIKNIAGQAAQKVAEKFRRIGANVDLGGVRLTVVLRGGNGMLDGFLAELKNLPGVTNAVLREQSKNRANISVDTTMTANALVQSIRNKGRFNVFTDSLSGNSATLILSSR